MTKKKSDSPQGDERIKIGARIRDCRRKKRLTLEVMPSKLGFTNDVVTENNRDRTAFAYSYAHTRMYLA